MQWYSFSYEERKRSLETVSSRHKESNTFEDFTARIFNPIQLPNTNISTSNSVAAALIDHHRGSVKSKFIKKLSYHI